MLTAAIDIALVIQRVDFQRMHQELEMCNWTRASPFSFMCTELHNFDRQVALLSNWPLPIFISLYLDWTLTRHLMKLVSPPSNHHNIKEKKISLFWPGKDVRDCSITFIIQSAFNSFIFCHLLLFYHQLSTVCNFINCGVCKHWENTEYGWK